MPTQHSTSQKRHWLDTRNRPFHPPPPFYQTTPFANLLTMSPSPLHWLNTSWWCFGQNAVVPLLPILLSFFPTPFLLLMYGLVSFCALHSFCPCLSFMGGGMVLLGLPHFCLFLGLSTTTFYWPARWAFFFFFSFRPFQLFVSAVTYQFLIIFLFHFLLGFPTVRPFFKKKKKKSTSTNIKQ